MCGVYSANELTRINLMKAYDFPSHVTPVSIGRRVAVIGSGNVAMDAARRCASARSRFLSVTTGAEKAEMPARIGHHAKEEGILFHFLTSPTRILDDGEGNAAGMECVRMALENPTLRTPPTGARAGSEFIMDAETVIVAIGNSPNPLIISTTEGSPPTNGAESSPTRRPAKPRGAACTPAGGRRDRRGATVILAIGAGKRAPPSTSTSREGGNA